MSDKRIVMYLSSSCAHSWAVERFLDKNEIDVDKISIDGNMIARAELMALNGGYASVPTLIFPDGAQLTEPSFRDLRRQLGINKPSFWDRLRGRSG